MTTFTLAVNQTSFRYLSPSILRANAERDYMDRAPADGQEAVGSIPTAAKADVAQRKVASTICRPLNGRTLIERSPSKMFLWFVAQLAEHLTVNEAVVGSNPIDPPSSGAWQKGVCTSLSTKTMTVRVRSVPPILRTFS